MPCFPNEESEKPYSLEVISCQEQVEARSYLELVCLPPQSPPSLRKRERDLTLDSA